MSPDSKKKRDESPTARRRRRFFTVLETLTVLFAIGAIGSYGDLLGTLGTISFQMGRHGLAEGLFRDSLRVQEKVHGPSGLELCWPLNQMAYFYYMTDQFDKAVPVAERSLAICRTNLGPKAPRCAWTVSIASLAYDGVGNFAEAERMANEALPQDDSIRKIGSAQKKDRSLSSG